MPESGQIPVKEGDLVAGKYRIERVIGTGGMGVIVAARHEQLDQRVAIKFVRDEALASEEGLQRFLREARAAARLKSEHAARVLDVDTHESGVPFMVMELLEGNDLAHWLTEHGPLAPELAAEWIVQACEAIAEAHASGIVHRDIKPQNLFLASTVGGATKIKVLDFGVSKSIDTSTSGLGSLTRTRSMLGSPLYMAPEQMRSSRDVDARADVWALGVVLFELLTRRWPFEADALPSLCLKVVSEPPQSLAELRPDLPDLVIQIVETCLEKDKEKRYANAAELASALEPLVPPRSRVNIERARGALSSATANAAAPLPISRSGDAWPPATRTPARSAPTPSAWGSGRRVGPPKKRPAPVLWAGIGVAALVLIGGGAFFVLRDRAGGEALPATSSSHPPAAQAGEPAATQAPRREGVAPVVTLSPPGEAPTASATVGATSPGASLAPKANPSSVPTSVPAATLRAGPAAAPALPTRTDVRGKPSRGDDDIPSLR